MNNSEIIKISKAFVKLITQSLSKDELNSKIPSVSYISDTLNKNVISLSVLNNLDGDTLIRVIFTTFNLMNGDSEENAVNKTKDIFQIDVKTSQSEPYNHTEPCDECEGSGYIIDDEDEEYVCQNCDGYGETETDSELIDVQLTTIVTQNPNLVETIKNNLDSSDNEIESFDSILNNYKHEILIIDIINDSVETNEEWPDYLDGARLEDIHHNFNNFKIKKGELTML